MPLAESELAALVERGCPSCLGTKLVVSAYVTQNLPLLEGELYGRPSWAYKGEDLVRGTFTIACVGCKATLYETAACFLCGRENGIREALEAESTFALPTKCGRCDGARMDARAYVPIDVVYAQKRTEKARTQVEPHEPGFHAFRAECKGCHEVLARHTPCALCDG